MRVLFSNPRAVPKRFDEQVIKGANVFGQGDDVNIVEEGENSLPVEELALEFDESLVLGEHIQRGHSRVSLLSALALKHFVGVTVDIKPHVGVRDGIELPGEGKERLERGGLDTSPLGRIVASKSGFACGHAGLLRHMRC